MSVSPVTRRLALLSTTSLLLALLSTGCSKDNSSASMAPDAGPVLNLSFPTTGTSHDVQFTTIGSWGYHCTAHPGMAGTIVVSASSSVPMVEVDLIDGNQFSPSTATIMQNGTIHWVNTSSTTTHTVTRP